MPPRFCAVHIDTLVPTLHPDTWIPLPVRGVPIPLLYTSFRVSPIFLPPIILTCTYNLTFPPMLKIGLKIDTTVVDTTSLEKVRSSRYHFRDSLLPLNFTRSLLA